MNDLMTQLFKERQDALDRAQSLIGTTLFDAYQVEQVLGAGTYGVTLKALDTMVEQSVAIKWIYRSYRDTVKKEFKMVAELSRLPCVPQYRFSREESGEYYLVMDYIGGGDLGRLIDKGGIPILQGLDLSLMLFRALGQVHSKRIKGRHLIHRDIKPANLLLDEAGELYITDFGAARIVSTTHQSRLSGTGTEGFMAPEISTGRYDQRVDIYSAGMVMYYLFGGKEPADPETLFYQEPYLSGAQKDALRGIVDRAMVESKEARYGSAEEVAQALEEVEHSLALDTPANEGRPALLDSEITLPPELLVRSSDPSGSPPLARACEEIFLIDPSAFIPYNDAPRYLDGRIEGRAIKIVLSGKAKHQLENWYKIGGETCPLQAHSFAFSVDAIPSVPIGAYGIGIQGEPSIYLSHFLRNSTTLQQQYLMEGLYSGWGFDNQGRRSQHGVMGPANNIREKHSLMVRYDALSGLLTCFMDGFEVHRVRGHAETFSLLVFFEADGVSGNFEVAFENLRYHSFDSKHLGNMSRLSLP